MRPIIFSLLLVLSVILIAPTVIVSCDQANAAQKEHVYLADAGSTAASALLVNQVSTVTPTEYEYKEQTVSPTETDLASLFTADDGLFSWQNIVVIVLGILSTFFAVLWKRAKSVIHEIDAALQNDGRIDKVELQRIIAAWKG